MPEGNYAFLILYCFDEEGTQYSFSISNSENAANIIGLPSGKNVWFYFKSVKDPSDERYNQYSDTFYARTRNTRKQRTSLFLHFLTLC